jgi:hypothetical protein
MRYVGVRQVVIDGEPTPCPHWAPTRDFAGKTVAVVGSGPSLRTALLEALKGTRFIAVNSACVPMRAFATADDVLYFTDNAWNENRPTLAATWPGVVITANRNVKARLGDKVRYIDVTALSTRMAVRADYSQASSSHIAASLACDMGAAKILLVGMDCRSVNGATHGIDGYPTCDDFLFVNRFLPGWTGLADAFARRGTEVVNVTPGSAIEDYRRGDLIHETNAPVLRRPA